MEMSPRIVVGLIISGLMVLISIVGGAIWLGELSGKVKSLEKGVSIENQKEEALEEIDNRIKATRIPSESELLKLEMPPGTIVAYAGVKSKKELIELGWLPCDGSEVDCTEKFAELCSLLGDLWGKANNIGRVKLPDLRGLFLRGTNHERNDEYSDPDVGFRKPNGRNKKDAPGSLQSYATASPKFNEFVTGPEDLKHTHRHQDAFFSEYIGGNQDLAGNQGPIDYDNGRLWNWQETNPNEKEHRHVIVAGGDLETRPKNAYVEWIMKY